MSRNTVAGYRRWADRHGLLRGDLPDAATLAALLHPPARERPRHEQSCVAPFRDQVVSWRQQGVEGQAIFQLLVEQHGFAGSYSAVKRFLRRVEPAHPRATIRVETEPGAEAQVDFGPAGRMLDPDQGRLRRAWASVMTLAYSRHHVGAIIAKSLWHCDTTIQQNPVLGGVLGRSRITGWEGGRCRRSRDAHYTHDSHQR